MIHVPCNLCGQDNWKVRFPATWPGLKDKDLPGSGNPKGLIPDVRAFRCTSTGYGHHLQVVECRHCGFVYVTPRWPAGELLQAYTDVEDETYQTEREGRELTFHKHLLHVESVIGPAEGRALLDVGAYIGVFVEVALGRGWQAVGVEPSSWAVGVAHERGLPVLHGTLDAPEWVGRCFDVITLWDVIEHVADPSAVIGRAFDHLQPGGTVVVHTMDIDSPIARLMGARWPWLMDMHLHYFSQRTLRQMLEQHGFRFVWSGTQGRYLRLGYLATRVEGLNRRLGRAAGALVGRLGLAEKVVHVNFGDLFTIYARKPE